MWANDDLLHTEQALRAVTYVTQLFMKINTNRYSSNARLRQSRELRRCGEYILNGGAYNLWALRTELPSYRSYSA